MKINGSLKGKASIQLELGLGYIIFTDLILANLVLNNCLIINFMSNLCSIRIILDRRIFAWDLAIANHLSLTFHNILKS